MKGELPRCLGIDVSNVSPAIKVGKFMCIERRERFMQDLGADIDNISAELVRNITDSNDSAKDLFFKISQYITK